MHQKKLPLWQLVSCTPGGSRISHAISNFTANQLIWQKFSLTRTNMGLRFLLHIWCSVLSGADLYRTQVYLGSDLWVRVSLTNSKTLLKFKWCDSKGRSGVGILLLFLILVHAQVALLPGSQGIWSRFFRYFWASLTLNIATGETSQAITSFHFCGNFNFFN